MSEQFKVGTGGAGSLAMMKIGDYDASGNIANAISLIVGNLKEYKLDTDRAVQVNYACGSSKPISINKGISKTEGILVFNVFDVDFLTNLCKLLNAFLDLSATDGGDNAIYKRFANMTLAKLNASSSSYSLEKGTLVSTGNNHTYFTPDLMSFDILPQFDLCIINDTSQEVVKGCKIFSSDTGVGTSSIGASTNYRFTATKIEPLALLNS